MPLVLAGATSGSTTIQATDAVTQTITLPNATGTVLTTNGSGIASVNGIQFPATQSASADANTLDDYEEGTWTPAINFGGASVGITYTIQTGYYVKIGRVVHVNCYLLLSNKGSSTGAIAFTGFPFTANNASSAYNTLSFYCGGATSTSGSYMCYIAPNTAYASLLFSQTGSPGTFSNTQCNNSSDFIIAGTYMATA